MAAPTKEPEMVLFDYVVIASEREAIQWLYPSFQSRWIASSSSLRYESSQRHQLCSEILIPVVFTLEFEMIISRICATSPAVRPWAFTITLHELSLK